jgi:hypothetical protein
MLEDKGWRNDSTHNKHKEKIMKYICLGYIDEKRWSTVPESEQQACMDECFGYDDILRENGNFAGGEALQSARKAVTLQWQNGKEALPEAKREKIMEEYHALEQDLVKSGHYRAGAKLGPSSTSTTVRLKTGKRAITDGPFAETKEQIGGYHLIECNNLDEAIAIALRIPTLSAGGTIEIRPVEHTTLGI